MFSLCCVLTTSSFAAWGSDEWLRVERDRSSVAFLLRLVPALLAHFYEHPVRQLPNALDRCGGLCSIEDRVVPAYGHFLGAKGKKAIKGIAINSSDTIRVERKRNTITLHISRDGGKRTSVSIPEMHIEDEEGLPDPSDAEFAATVRMGSKEIAFATKRANKVLAKALEMDPSHHQ